MRLQFFVIVNWWINPFLLQHLVNCAGTKNETKLNTTTYPLSRLSRLLSPFSQCLIHLINYRYLDIPSTTIPLVLEKYPSQKYLRSLKRRQNDNFRWRCVFHGFLYPPMPNGWAPHSLFRYHAFYTEFWTGPVKVKKERFSNLIRHQDYYVYFMNRKSSRNWLQFAQGVQETQGQGGMFSTK